MRKRPWVWHHPNKVKLDMFCCHSYRSKESEISDCSSRSGHHRNQSLLTWPVYQIGIVCRILFSFPFSFSQTIEIISDEDGEGGDTVFRDSARVSFSFARIHTLTRTLSTSVYKYIILQILSTHRWVIHWWMAEDVSNLFVSVYLQNVRWKFT